MESVNTTTLHNKVSRKNDQLAAADDDDVESSRTVKKIKSENGQLIKEDINMRTPSPPTSPQNDTVDCKTTTSSSSSSSSSTTAAAATTTTTASLADIEDFTRDWPRQGDLDLKIHDLPHHNVDTEWWYVNSHVRTPEGREFSVFASFFRIVKRWNDAKQDYDYAYAVTWAVVDIESGDYLYDGLLDADSPSTIRDELKKATDVDPRVRRAFDSVLSRNRVPLPDRLMKVDGVSSDDHLNVDLEGNVFRKDDKGHYVVTCRHPDLGFGFEFTFAPQRQPIRHGHDGVVKIGRKGDEMFYYFIPRCAVQGTVTINNQPIAVQGQGWYDHEFGGLIRVARPGRVAPPKPPGLDYAWNWLSVQLDDGRDLTATTVCSPKENRILDNFTLMIHPDSRREEFTECQLIGENNWMSERTTFNFPTRWVLQVPEADIHLVAEAVMTNQEFITLLTKGSFWEGRLNVTGTIKGQAVRGKAFLERNGFETMKPLDEFFSRISKIVRNEIAKLMPEKPTHEDVRGLMANDSNDHYLDGMDLNVFAQTMIHPVREYVDRGGKAWRSYAFLLCMDAVGGNSHKYRHLLSMPELMHVGSLIVDDVQDRSETRRGGPTCHLKYGEPLAINCGTSAYFLGMHILAERTPGLTALQRATLYDSYILTLRAGHAGQALDIHGLDYLMDGAVESGDNTRLLKSIICTHRLKSAVPAGNLGRMGAYIANGTHQQQEALGRYMEAIGIAFQVIDDVLNLRGLPGKVRGEDISAGKVTYPVAVAMTSSRLNLEQRQKLWAIIRTKSTDQQVVEQAVQMIDQCGALQSSEDDAVKMVEDAWKILDDAVPDSFYKIHLHAFGEYVIQRHY